MIGCHPNTVRKYEEWGLLPPVERNAKGYRLYTQAHVDQMRLARLAFDTPFPGSKIRKSTYRIVITAASGDLGGALSIAYAHLGLVRSEMIQSESVVEMVRHWAAGQPLDTTTRPIRIQAAAHLLDISCDMIRNWEANGLISIPRDPQSRYRQLGQSEIARLRVIRLLRTAGYSTIAILRMLHQLDTGQTDDIQWMLNTPPEDEEIEYATDRWMTTLKIQEETSLKIIQLLEELLRRH
jgi:DNA-binding transcriptional MerR regulator